MTAAATSIQPIEEQISFEWCLANNIIAAECTIITTLNTNLIKLSKLLEHSLRRTLCFMHKTYVPAKLFMDEHIHLTKHAYFALAQTFY